MSFRKVSRIALAIIIIILLIGTAVSYAYMRQDGFFSILKQGLETKFCQWSGADVRIGSIRGNIFRKIVLRDVGFRIKNYIINFETAQLEYSLWGLISENRSKELEKEIFVILKKGTLKLDNNVIISSRIDAKVRLKPDKIFIESLGFRLFDLLDNHIEGEIIKDDQKLRLELILKIRPFFEKDRKFFEEVTISAKGPPENLSLYGSVNRLGAEAALAEGYAIYKDEILNIGSKLKRKVPLDGLKEDILLMDTEIKTKESKFSTVFITDIGRIIFNLDYSKWPHINADIINEHINIAELDFYNIIHLAAKAVFNKKGFSHLALDLSTESSVLNYYPIDELEGSFLIDKDVARLIYLKMGDSVSATGAFTLKPPRKAFLKLVLAGYDISRPFIISGEEKPPVSGRLSGEIFIEGPLDDLKTKAALSVKEGYLGDVEYNDMIINLEGIGPLLRIHDSRIIRKDSFLTIEGTADTKRFGTSAFLEDVVISTDEKTIIWEGWDISRPVGNELKFSRDLAGGLKVGFKTQMPDERVYRPQELGRELAVEHKLSDREYEAVQFKAKDDEEFLGVIKKYKF